MGLRLVGSGFRVAEIWALGPDITHKLAFAQCCHEFPQLPS